MEIKVTRAFYLAGQPQAVGAVVDVGILLARELIALGKAEAVVAPPPEAAPALPSRRRKPVTESVD